MTDKELIKQEIENLKAKVDDESSYSNGWKQALRAIEIFTNSLSEESGCEVDFTAKAEYNKIKELALEMGEEGSFGYSHAFSILSKLNEWQKQQMMKDAVEGVIDIRKWPAKAQVEFYDRLPVFNVRTGDKVKIIFVKEE